MLEIRNAILPNGKKKNILIHKHKIIEVGDLNLNNNFLDVDSLHAIPGLIDPHVHFRIPGAPHKEDWETGTLSSLFGGVTTVLPMPNTHPSLSEYNLINTFAKSAGRRDVSYKFWFGASRDNFEHTRAALDHKYVKAIKLYMGSSTGDLLVCEDDLIRKHFQIAAEKKKIIGVHAEDELLMRRNRASLDHEPRISDHCYIRDTEVEISAVRRALKIQSETQACVYFCHISSPESLELIHNAKQKGALVYVEVCPHHLFLDNTVMDGFKKMNPPLRSLEQVARMRELVCRKDFVDTIGSDHAPHTIQEKENHTYDTVPSGVPGVQTIFSLMYQFVYSGQMSLSRFIELTSTNAAKIFGFEDKGEIDIGSDADIVLFDPNEPSIITNAQMKTKCGWTPFHGINVKGVIKYVISQGTLLKI